MEVPCACACVCVWGGGACCSMGSQYPCIPVVLPLFHASDLAGSWHMSKLDST